MKRILMITLALAVMFLAAASANADTYKVRKGDCLSKIALRYHVKWQAIHKANKRIIKNPNRIYPGQELIMPEKESPKKVEAVPYKKIKKLGTKPFIGDPAWALRAIGGYTESEIAELVRKIKTGKQDDWDYLEKGDKVSMAYGEKGFYPKAEMDFPEGHLEAVKIYRATSGKEVWLPLACNNPTKLLVPRAKKEEQEPSADEPLKVFAETSPEPEPEEDEEELLALLLPQPVQVVEETAPEQPAVVLEEKVCCQPDSDITVGAFADRHQSGNNPHGIWGVANIFVCKIKDGDKIHSFGFTLEGNYWQGETSDQYHYYGSRYAIDAAYRLFYPNTEFQVRVGMGKVNDWGFIVPNEFGRYESNQTSTIITAYTGYEKTRTGTPWFNRTRFYASVDYDISRDKSDQWVDNSTGIWSLNGEPSNKTMYNLGVDGSVYKINNNVSLAAGVSLTHYQEGSVTGLRASPGVDFYGDGILLGNARVNPTYWSTSDHAVGISAMADLSNIYLYLKKKFASPPDSKIEENKN